MLQIIIGGWGLRLIGAEFARGDEIASTRAPRSAERLRWGLAVERGSLFIQALPCKPCVLPPPARR